MDRENSPIDCFLEQAASIVRRSKIAAGTLEQTKSYKRGQIEELKSFADSNPVIPTRKPKYTEKFSRFEIRCHCCQTHIKHLWINEFLWQRHCFFVVIRCHTLSLLWQRMTRDFRGCCHRNWLCINTFTILWQQWQRNCKVNEISGPFISSSRIKKTSSRLA